MFFVTLKQRIHSLIAFARASGTCSQSTKEDEETISKQENVPSEVDSAYDSDYSDSGVNDKGFVANSQ